MTGPNNDSLQVFYGTLPLVGAILLGQWKEAKRLDDFRTSINKRLDDLSVSLNARMADMGIRLGKIEDRLADPSRVLR